jgi:hypothetical protein
MKRVILFFLLLLHPMEYIYGIIPDENKLIPNSLNILLDITKELNDLKNDFESQKFNSTIGQIDLICSGQITDTVQKDINEIINQTEKTQSLDRIFPSFTLRLKLYFPEIVINEFRFRTLVSVQHQLSFLHRNLSDLDRLISSAEHATFNKVRFFL